MTTTSDFLRHLRTLTARQANDLLSDQQLLERFLHERSETSFAALVQRHGPMVLNVCRRVLHHTQDAEDAFQATFLILARKAGSIRKPASLSSWLHGVAHHSAECLKAKRQRRAAHEHRVDPPPPGDAMDDITWRELRSVLDEELQRLPEKYRAPLVLCYLEAHTQDEATRRLGWSKNTFGRRMNQARQMLARRLTRRGLTLPAALTAPLLIDGAATAALPPLLAANTVRAGLATAMGQATGALVSAQVVALTESGIGLLLAKKASIALILLVSLMLGLGGLLAHRAAPSGTFAEAPAAPPAPTPQPARSKNEDQGIEIKGRVLDPDGQPLADAKVYLSMSKDDSVPKIRAETGADGRFLFASSRAEVDHGVMAVAEAPRYGPDWVSLKEARDGKELTLRLVKDDVPIKGRLLDLEGRPIAGATVRFEQLQKMPGEDLTSYLKELQAKPTDKNAVAGVDSRYRRITSVIVILRSPKPVKTGPDGRFELRGIGRERVVDLSIEGPGIESQYVVVMTRPGLAKGLPLDRHGPIFDHLAAPSKPIRGTVREKETGKPLAGITVHVEFPINRLRPELWEYYNATTDEQGRYQFDSIAKQREYTVLAVGRPYFAAIKRSIADTPGFEPLVVDFELERGIAITGHVRNKATGQPIRAVVAYHVPADNPNFKKISFLGPRIHIRDTVYDTTGPDGSFAVVGLPGPGYLVVVAREDDYRKLDPPSDWKTVAPPIRSRHPLVHAWVRIGPSENDPKSTHCEIALEPAKSISGQVHDPEGKPLKGFFVADLTATTSAVSNELNLRETPSFRVRGLDPDRPRALAIIQPEKKLGKIVIVRGNQPDPLQVYLEPLGAVAGRVLDADGHPRSGLQVHALVRNIVNDDNLLPTSFLTLQWGLRQYQLGSPTKTDSAGKFRVDGLMPGIKYTLSVGESETKTRTRIVTQLKNLTVESGKTKDLGDLKTRLAPKEAQQRP